MIASPAAEYALRLALLGCLAGCSHRAAPPRPPQQGAAGTTQSDLVKSVRRPVTAEALLADIGERFGSGLTADAIAILGGAPGAIRAGNSWQIDLPQLHLTVVVVATKANDVSSWLMVYVTPDSALRVKDLVRLFGPYRKLPPGEYTMLIFNTFRPSEMTVSADSLLMANEPASRPAVVRFQKPWGVISDEAPGPRG